MREAILDIAAGTTRAALFALVLAFGIAVPAGADIATIASLERQASQYRLSGGTTLVYQAKAGIDGVACDSLRRAPGVVAAGAIRQRGSAEIAATLPAQEIPTFEISIGFGGFAALGGPHADEGVLVSQDLAETLGASPGQKLPLTDGTPVVGAVYSYPADGRLPGYGYALLIPADPRSAFDECWVEAWPVTGTLNSLLPTTLRPGAVPSGNAGAQGPRLQQLNSSLGAHFDGQSLYGGRVTRFAPELVLVVGLGLGFTAVLRRKLELASARHSGVSPVAQALQMCVESLVWALAGVCLAVPALVLLASVIGDGSSAALPLAAVRVVAGAVPAVVLGALGATLCVRERQLFRYFKAR
ncbi:hypothetical protein [Leifsonia shinshuensis]|uniref:ABC transporter permease n=1 Tax=Leifsonia shinshuensis TaxID=150026 RepID=A0A853CWA1_9MICO|nr:hypothetical protein [Leifsonia shinshuensis]